MLWSEAHKRAFLWDVLTCPCGGRRELIAAVTANQVLEGYGFRLYVGPCSYGTFAAKVDYTVGAEPLGVAVGDFNGDSKSDLAIANYNSSTVSVLLSQCK